MKNKVYTVALLSLASCGMIFVASGGHKSAKVDAEGTTVIDPTKDIGAHYNITSIADTGWKTTDFNIGNVNQISNDGDYIAVAMKVQGGVWGGFKLVVNDTWYQQSHYKDDSSNVVKPNLTFDFNGENKAVPNYRDQYLPAHLDDGFNGYFVMPKSSFANDGADKATTPADFSKSMKTFQFTTYYTNSTVFDLEIGNVYSASIVNNKLVLGSAFIDWTDLSKSYSISSAQQANTSTGRANADKLEIINTAIAIDKYDISSGEKVAACKAAYQSVIEGYSANELAVFNSVLGSNGNLVSEKWQAIMSGLTPADLAAQIVEKFNAIGTVTVSSREAIAEARKAYDSADAEVKALITEEQLKVLTDAEAAFPEAVAKAAPGDVAIANSIKYQTKSEVTAGGFNEVRWYMDDLENRNVKMSEGEYVALRIKAGANGSYFDISMNVSGNSRTQALNGDGFAELFAADGSYLRKELTRGWRQSMYIGANFDGYYLFPKAKFTNNHFGDNEIDWNANLSAIYCFFYAHDDVRHLDFEIGNIYNANIVEGKMQLGSCIMNTSSKDSDSIIKGFAGQTSDVVISRTNPEVASVAELAQKIIEVDTTDLTNCKNAASLLEQVDGLKGEFKNYVLRASRANVTVAQQKADIEGMIAAEEPAAAVDGLIDLIPDTIVYTEECEEKIVAAREAYDDLTKYGKSLISAAQLKILTDAEAEYASLKAEAEATTYHENTVALFEDIGTVELTPECKAKIDLARSTYEALPETVKGLFTEQEMKILTDAEAEYADLLAQSEADAVVAMIEAIGEVHINSKAAIEEARAAYEALSVAAKAKVTEAQLKVLTDAEAAYPDIYMSEAEADVDLYSSVHIVTNETAVAGAWHQTQWYFNEFESRDVSLDEGEYIAIRMKVTGPGSYFEIIPNVSGNASSPEYTESEGLMNAIAVRTTGMAEVIQARTWRLAINLRGEFDGYYLFPKEAFTHLYFGDEINWEDDLSALYFFFYTIDASNALDIQIGNIYNADYDEETGMVLNDVILDLANHPGTEILNGIPASYGGEMTYSRNGEGLDELVALGRQVLDVDLSDVNACAAALASLETSLSALTESEHLFFDRISHMGVTVADALETMQGMVAAKEAAEACAALIDAIPDTIELTQECVNKIEAATTAFAALDEYGVAQVGEARAAKLLEAAETIVDMSNAADVVELIDAIGTVEYSSASKTKIDAARAAYNELTDDAKAFVSAAKVKVLTDAEAKYAELKTAAEELAIAKEAKLQEIDEFSATVDLSKYSAENRTVITEAVEKAKADVSAETDISKLSGIVETLKTTVNAIEQVKADEPKESKGCGGSVVASVGIVSIVTLLGAGLLAKKRKQD